MSTLLEIGADMQSLMALLEESDGEITPENSLVMDAWFNELESAQDQKLDGYVAIVREFQLRAAVRKEEQERLAKRVQADENTAKRLKDRLKLYLEMTGQQKVETRRYKLSVCNNGGLIPVKVPDDPFEVPEKFRKVEVSVNVESVRKALEAGASVPGAVLLPRGTHLRIT